LVIKKNVGLPSVPSTERGFQSLSLSHTTHSLESHIIDLFHALKVRGCLELLIQMLVKLRPVKTGRGDCRGNRWG
jgi:hypothetical protein